MSPFIIYAIVLNIAYILYYATLITMDMHAKPKDEGSHTESIPVEDHHEAEDQEPAPKVVTENIETGDFNIDEHIQEAETEQPTSETCDTEDLTPTSSTSEEQHEEENTYESTAETNDKTETDAVPEEAADNSPEETEDNENEEAEDDESETAPIIPSVSFEEDSTVEEPEKKQVNDKDLFDENKLQPQYGVTSINGHPIDEQVTHTLNNIREKLGAYKLAGNMFTAGELKKIVTSSDNNHNIETRNECTKW